jgi:arabinose-5-phosphate isomerase
MTQHDTAVDRLARASDVLQIEADAILALKQALQSGPVADAFGRLVDLILALPGKVVVTGVGKSGIVGQKIAATMCSTGTPAVYLDATGGLHGDLGVLDEQDLLIAISNSGEAIELLNVVAGARQIGARIVGVTGNPESTLGEASDLVLNVRVEREACPLGLAPTASTTATLAMGDALAMVLMECIGFSEKHYARYHPGGSLGQRLKLRVVDIMRTGDDLPVVRETDSFARALDVMSSGANLGVALVTDADGVLAGIITDGDVRRLARNDDGTLSSRTAGDVMKRTPMTIAPDVSASEAVRVMEKGTGKGSITSLAIVDAHCRPTGIIHLHDVLGRGKFMV